MSAKRCTQRAQSPSRARLALLRVAALRRPICAHPRRFASISVIAIGIIAALTIAGPALAGNSSRESSSLWKSLFGRALSAERPQYRIAELKRSLEITPQQALAWDQYAGALLAYRLELRHQRESELRAITSPGAEPMTTAESLATRFNPDLRLDETRAVLKIAYAQLRATMNSKQIFLANKILTSGECGR